MIFVLLMSLTDFPHVTYERSFKTMQECQRIEAMLKDDKEVIVRKSCSKKMSKQEVTQVAYGYCFKCGYYCGLKGMPPRYQCSHSCGYGWHGGC